MQKATLVRRLQRDRMESEVCGANKRRGGGGWHSLLLAVHGDDGIAVANSDGDVAPGVDVARLLPRLDDKISRDAARQVDVT